MFQVSSRRQMYMACAYGRVCVCVYTVYSSGGYALSNSLVHLLMHSSMNSSCIRVCMHVE